MRCVMCGRHMKKAAAFRRGCPFGPKCAEELGLLTRFVPQIEQPEIDTRQMALQLEESHDPELVREVPTVTRAQLPLL